MKLGLWMCLLCLLFSGITGYAASIHRQDKRILYVGYSPDRERPVYKAKSSGYASEKRFDIDVRERMVTFKQLLQNYFTVVETVDARDYKQEMSQKYDVTIFDALPEPIVASKDIRDENGKYLRTEQEKYLSPDFDCPAVFIAHTGGLMRQGLDLKIDWCCLCLDAYAHHIHSEHEVFRKPFPVELTYESCATPLMAYNYLNGYALPDSIPMWRVQTSGYRDGKGQRIGLVSFGEGFNDSPDAEAISGGMSLKNLNAVAIARHGNFLLWGFAASPNDLTPEAQTVFANCVAYISQFKGERPVVRKVKQVVTVREFVDDLLWVVSPEGYSQYVHKKQLMNEDRRVQKEQVLQKMKEKGEDVDIQMLEKKYSPAKILSREDFYTSFLGEELGRMAMDDLQKCRKYIETNRPYFYGLGTFNQFVIDEDAQKLGIANTDKRLLKKCITLLGKKQEAELAERVLVKYTCHQFSTPEEWQKWYKKNEKNLFFTEVGGYKFMENIQQPSELLREEGTDIEPVSVSVRLVQKEGKDFVAILFRIKEGYHIYADSGKENPFIPTTLEFEFPEHIQGVGELLKPQEVLLAGGEGIMVYEKEVEFLQQIVGSGKGDIKCWVGYQCCNDQICLPPVKKEVIVVK